MISIIMSIYNETLKWISQAIESILGQTYTNFEFIIIVDNPRIDNTIIEYIKSVELRDKRVVVEFNEKNLGLARTLNKGISLSKGFYIARMDADDISAPDRLQKELAFLTNNDYDVVSANKIDINENDEIVRKEPIIKRNPNTTLEYSNIIVHPLVLAKSESLKKMGGYRQLRNSEDYDLWLRMIDTGYKFGILEEYLLKYRIRSNSASVERQLEQYYVNNYILMLHHQRKRKGKDNFSEENQNSFLKKCIFSEKMRNKIGKASHFMELALTAIYDKKVFYASKYLLCSIYCYPSFTVKKITNYIRSFIGVVDDEK